LIIGVMVVMWQKRESLRDFQMRLLSNSVESAPTTMRTQASDTLNEDDLENIMRKPFIPYQKEAPPIGGTEMRSTRVRDEAGLIRDTSLDRVTSTDERVTSTDSVTPTDESGLIRGTSMDSVTSFIRGTSMDSVTSFIRGTSMDSVTSSHAKDKGAEGEVAELEVAWRPC